MRSDTINNMIPQVTPMSAMLKIGKSINVGSMKSTTKPRVKRSIALPMPPATTSDMPMSSPAFGCCGGNARYAVSAMQTTSENAPRAQVAPEKILQAPPVL